MDCRRLSERERLLCSHLGNCTLKFVLAGIHVELSHLKSKLKGLESGGSGTKSPFAQRLKHEHVVLDSLQKVAKSHTAAFQVTFKECRRGKFGGGGYVPLFCSNIGLGCL